MAGEDHVAIDLVRDDGEAVPRGDGEQALQVGAGEDGARGVGRVVDDDGAGLGGDGRLEVGQIDLPFLVRLKVVGLHDAADGLDDHLCSPGSAVGGGVEGRGSESTVNIQHGR